MTSNFLQTYYPQALSFSNPLSSTSIGSGSQYGFPSMSLPQTGEDLNKVEARTGYAYQNPTNVLNVGNQLQNVLGQYQKAAQTLSGQNTNLGRISLNNNFLGGDAYQNRLRNGIDYFGNLGISEGLQNINLQRDAQNAQLAQQLGRMPGNDTLLGILQNQNLMRSQLAANPLISQAQKDTAGRTAEAINLQNQLVQLQNQTKLQQGGYNQQAQLGELQARLGLQQPQQNLLEILSNLQGQARGVTSGDQTLLGRNFK